MLSPPARWKWEAVGFRAGFCEELWMSNTKNSRSLAYTVEGQVQKQGEQHKHTEGEQKHTKACGNNPKMGGRKIAKRVNGKAQNKG